MGTGLKLCAMLACAFMAFGCASRQENQTASEAATPVAELVPGYSMDEPASTAAGNAVVNHARKHLGTPYVLGGTKPGGFDCSGFVMWTYNRVGVELPRTAREQSTVGKKITRVEDMRPGDIVAFNHPKRGYHTGIYLGDGKFIHSPRKKSFVKINSLSDSYFSKTLLGARRVSFDGSEPLVAQAESQLDTYMASRGTKTTAAARAKAGKTRAGSRSAAKAAASKKQSDKAVASKTTKQARALASKTTKQGKTIAAKGNAAKTAKAKQAAKTLAHHNAKAKGSATAKASPKKNSSRAVSMLQQKQAKAAKSGKRS